MKHATLNEWLRYVKDETKTQDRQKYEDHLYECEQCLELYLKAVNEVEEALPDLPNQSSFTDKVMAEVGLCETRRKLEPSSHPNLRLINNRSSVEKSGTGEQRDAPGQRQIVYQSRPFYQSAAFHYILAAAMTLLFMFAGVFQSLTQYTGDIHVAEKQESSITEGLVNKTFMLIDSLEVKVKEENRK
ncbi:hypothetical protein [Mesobacillus harenae]|uniref:hypothetical protein n=1 Tax=Mesobacillus harenae TaxID=2213203 RepID=UPI001580A640|nr:hypothetical protein [Mesobacillus harenae]